MDCSYSVNLDFRQSSANPSFWELDASKHKFNFWRPPPLSQFPGHDFPAISKKISLSRVGRGISPLPHTSRVRDIRFFIFLLFAFLREIGASSRNGFLVVYHITSAVGSGSPFFTMHAIKTFFPSFKNIIFLGVGGRRRVPPCCIPQLLCSEPGGRNRVLKEFLHSHMHGKKRI